MQWLLYPLVVVAGFLNPVQAGCNTALMKALDRPFMIGLISAVVTGLAVGAGALLTGQVGLGDKAGQAPWWAWLGGIAGAIFVTTQPIAAPKLGAAPFIGITVTASVIGSVLLDQYALLGFQQHTASAGRLIGAGLMVLGVVLVAVF